MEEQETEEERRGAAAWLETSGRLQRLWITGAGAPRLSHSSSPSLFSSISGPSLHLLGGELKIVLILKSCVPLSELFLKFKVGFSNPERAFVGRGNCTFLV